MRILTYDVEIITLVTTYKKYVSKYLKPRPAFELLGVMMTTSISDNVQRTPARLAKIINAKLVNQIVASRLFLRRDVRTVKCVSGREMT